MFELLESRESSSYDVGQRLGGVWFMFSHNNFQFLNNILHILMHFLLICIFTNIFK